MRIKPSWGRVGSALYRQEAESRRSMRERREAIRTKRKPQGVGSRGSTGILSWSKESRKRLGGGEVATGSRIGSCGKPRQVTRRKAIAKQATGSKGHPIM